MKELSVNPRSLETLRLYRRETLSAWASQIDCTLETTALLIALKQVAELTESGSDFPFSVDLTPIPESVHECGYLFDRWIQPIMRTTDGAVVCLWSWSVSESSEPSVILFGEGQYPILGNSLLHFLARFFYRDDSSYFVTHSSEEKLGPMRAFFLKELQNFLPIEEQLLEEFSEIAISEELPQVEIFLRELQEAKWDEE